MIARIAFIAALAALFIVTLGHPVQPEEATAALAAVDACHTGNAISSHQLGEHESARLPLQTWILSGLAGWRAENVDVRAARWLSFIAILAAAVVGSAGFGPARRTTPALILVTPAIWEVAVHGGPGALLAFLLTLAWGSYAAGRRLRAPTLQWSLPPILGAAASLSWAPAILFVALPLSIEVLRLAPRRKVAWLRLALGWIFAVAVIGLWQLADAGFVLEPRSWWDRMVGDLITGDSMPATRSLVSRLTAASAVMLPAVVLAVVGGWPRRVLPASKEQDEGPGTGIAVAAVAIVASAVFLPGVPPAATIPAGIAALAFLGTRRLLKGSVERTRKLEIAAVAALSLWVAFDVLHHPREGRHLQTSALEAVERDTPVVVDRELGPRETWAVVAALGRPATRRAEPGRAAWFVGPAPVGPGLAIEFRSDPTGWSLLGRPLGIPELPATTAADFEAKLAAAREAYEASPGDALASIWVGRRIAYLGRYGEAIGWYGDALTAHPDDSRLWRHRGHRYISLRQLDHAIRDLERAAELERGRADRVEPDGLPNAAGIPRSTTQTNIWYHLGLAYYLKGDLENSVRCFRRCAELSPNDDSWVSAAHWLHIGLRRTGRAAEAVALLAGLRDDMEILENDGYHDLLKLYTGQLEAQALQQRLDTGDGASQAALAYGLARWYEDSGDEQSAVREYRRIVTEAPSAAFGSIAAEAELARRSKSHWPVW